MTDKEFDEGLKGVMGDRFHDVTEIPAQTINVKLSEKPTAKPYPKKQSNPGKECPEKEKPVAALWEPVKPAPNFMDKLKSTVKDVCLWAFLSLVLFWWQQSGRLETTTSWYALLVCVGMVFFSIGKNCRGGVK
jgi:hypothetical protein